MPQPSVGWQRWGVAVVLACALAACTIGPAPPLLSPLDIARSYGYADAPLGPDRYQVTYLGPDQRVVRGGPGQADAAAGARSQAYDFAIWHAAQLALARGFDGFRVSNTRTDVNTLADDYPPPYPGPVFGPENFAGHYPNDPFWGPNGWGPSPYALQQVKVTIDVELVHGPGPGDYLAQSAIDQLRRTYPGAEAPG